MLVLFLAYKLFLFATFEPVVARFYGVPTGWVDTLFALLLAATIVVSMQVLGVMLIAAATVIPPVVARLLTDSFRKLVLISTALGTACGLLGIYISWFLDLSSGASVVLLSATVFVAVLAWNGLKGHALTWRRTALSHSGRRLHQEREIDCASGKPGMGYPACVILPTIINRPAPISTTKAAMRRMMRPRRQATVREAPLPPIGAHIWPCHGSGVKYPPRVSHAVAAR